MGGSPTLAAAAALRERIFPDELREIRRRRARLGVPGDLPTGATPSAALGLVGLAFWGGGIRSASFRLGVLRQIARAGAPRHVDYLSTVSGGGYVGSCVSAVLGAPLEPEPATTTPFPLSKSFGEVEAPALRHPRNGSIRALATTECPEEHA